MNLVFHISEDGSEIELTQIYSTRLQQLGVATSTRVNSTRLKHIILTNVPGLQAYKQERDVMLAFNDGIGQALKDLHEHD